MKNKLLLVIILSIHLLLLFNLRFEAWPEMLVYPYLMKNGFWLYTDIINAYLPLFNWVLQLYFSILTLNLINLKLLTWGIILISDLMIYIIIKKHSGIKAALIGLIFFVIFQPLLDGNGLWYDLALTPILLLSYYLQSPFILSLAFYVKQSVLWLLPIFYRQYKKVFLSLCFLFILSSLPFIYTKTLPDYIFWAWQFPYIYFPFMPGHKDWGTIGLWAIALLPFILPISLAKRSIKLIKNPLVWMLLSFLFVFPRFGLFHLQPALAFAALVLAQNYKKIKLPLATLTLVAASFFWFRQITLFWHQPVRFFEPQIISAAKELEKTTMPHETLLFLNVPDQLMVLSQRLPTKPWATTFPWLLEIDNMQARFISALQNQQVETVVFSPFQNQGKYIPGSYIPEALYKVVQSSYTNVKILPANVLLLTKP